MAKDEKIGLLKEVLLFWRCSDKELKRIASIADAVDHPSGTVFMDEGAAGHEMMLIADGTVSPFVVAASDFSSLLREVPAVALQILTNVARRLRRLEDHVIH